MRTVYVNGDYLPEDEARISIFDRGFLMADGVYEVTSVLGGKLIDFAGHAKRLERSLGELDMAAPVDMDELLEIHRELVSRNGIDEGMIYLLSKRDPLPRLYRLPIDSPPLLPVTAEFVGEISSLPLPNSGQLEPAGSITNVSPTAFSFSEDGQYALIVTLEHSYRYRRLPGRSWIEALNNAPEVIAVPDYPQIESGEFIGHGPGLLIGSEGSPAQIYASAH